MADPSIVPYYGNIVLRFDSTRGYPMHLNVAAQATTDRDIRSAPPPSNPFLGVPQDLVTHSRDLVALEWDNVRREVTAITKAVLERDQEQQAEHAARARAFERWMSVRGEK
ncbi:hypothetical protein PMIN06_006382 [Paraphaeosphaeria minitans]|uniref:Uncharacterized protein n=1 Tax=Paraphaeosphaeria minitans TaxID=565426 RepID=A0A9P6GAB8_9PLEO|nr:hypothetical protein PMIN01_11599 [Paraphaeosphaeria minitans]